MKKNEKEGRRRKMKREEGEVYLYNKKIMIVKKDVGKKKRREEGR
jgi:hypothetical protein